MVVLDATVVNIALPTAQKALGFSNDAGSGRHRLRARLRQSAAARRTPRRLLRAQARVHRRPGRVRAARPHSVASRRASAMLVAARALQGAFGALLAPAALALLTTTFTDPRSAPRRSASTVRSPAAVARSACCWAACSPSTLVALVPVREPADRGRRRARRDGRCSRNQGLERRPSSTCPVR